MTGTGNGRLLARMARRIGLGMITAAVLTVPAPQSWAGLTRRIDPAQVLPLDQLPAEFRESVAEVIRDHTFHRQGEPDSFPCNAGLYLSLVNEPVLTLALWKDLAESPVQLRRLGANRYQGEDGAGTTATWDFVLRTPRLHVMLAYLNYASPRSTARIDARIVLILHTAYYREVNSETYVHHDVEAFVKVDSRGWKTLARTFRPVIERLLEDQVREAGQFVSLMSRLVVMHPNWATQIAANQAQLDSDARSRFCDIVAQNRQPGASNGRPVVIANSGAEPADTRRR
jgi:hypothetical protein